MSDLTRGRTNCWTPRAKGLALGPNVVLKMKSSARTAQIHGWCRSSATKGRAQHHRGDQSNGDVIDEAWEARLNGHARLTSPMAVIVREVVGVFGR